MGGSPLSHKMGKPKTIADLINLHIADLMEVGNPLRRSKFAALKSLKQDLGVTRIGNLDRAALIRYGMKRAKNGAGPVTLSIDLSYLHTVLTHAAAIHGIGVDTDGLRLARVALIRLDLVGRSNERNRRPSSDEIDDLLNFFDCKTNMIIPMGWVVRFAIATAMRQEEIFKIEWADIGLKKRLVLIQDRKNSRHKDGNDQKVPLLNLTGFGAWQ